MQYKDRIKGMFLAGALGDALGGPFEFRFKEYPITYNGRLKYQISHFNRFRGWRRSAIGQVTDDTEMTLCLANSILERRGHNPDHVVTQYLEWGRSNAHFYGRNTRELLVGIKTLRGYRNRYRKKFENTNATPQSNGVLMRCSPLAVLGLILDRETREQVSNSECNSTNPDPVARICVQIQLYAIRLALKGKEKGEIFAKIRNRFAGNFEVVDNVFRAVENSELIDVRGKLKGWCMHALYCSLFGLMNCDSFPMAMDRIINFGGDTDTNACICGSLLGAYYGYGALMADETTRNNANIMFNCDTESGDIPRPEKYRFTKANFKRICRGFFELLS